MAGLLGKGLSALLAGLAGVTLVAAPAAAAAVVRDGSTSDKAAASCWEIKQRTPSSKDGVYWLQTPRLVAPQQFYCDMTTDGGGWVLVGRGREGWNFYHNGQGSAKNLRENPSGPAAFAPATLPAETINGLLDGSRPGQLPDGVRVRRAANIQGTRWQEIRYRLASAADWTWAFDGGIRLNRVTVNGKAYAAQNTQNWNAPRNNGGLRIFTNDWVGHNRKMGFSYGKTVVGRNNPNSYLWQWKNEGHAIPFAQVFIRPKITSPSFPAVPDSGSAASTVRPLMKNVTEPTPWGVTGIKGGFVGGKYDERNMEVEDFAFIGDTVYVGGKFQYVQKGPNPGPGEKVEQSYLAAFDVNTGEWRPAFRPVLDGMVYSLSAGPDGKLLVGGHFTNVNGKPDTRSLAKLDANTGEVDTSWTTHVTNGTDISNVRSMDQQDGWLYLGGNFNRITGGKTTTPITLKNGARVSLADGTPDPAWKPHIDGPVYELDASEHGDRVYFVGRFSHVNGTATAPEAAVSTAPGAPLAGVKPMVGNEKKILYQQTVTEAGDKVWLGGTQHLFGLYDRGDFGYRNSTVTRHGGDFQASTVINGVAYGACHCLKFQYRFGDGARPTILGKAPASASDVNKIDFVGAWDAETGQELPQFYIPGLWGRNNMGPWALRGDKNGCLWFGGDFIRGPWVGTGYQWLGGFGKVCGRDTIAPSAPLGLSARQEADGVHLHWNKATDNSGSPVYEVVRDDRVIATVGGSNFTAPAGAAKYWVRAVDATGNRSASTPATVAG
ncbi:fibrinogen-like YCDxxxxGGGW domain-containing protein [Amycolatopsis sp. GM8]|uniref:fibrinogen-like YCDxxxxGGGW domain-containing protein n=1 Tax=Amycolatopsis sp. GM8 TaxID=2896530 RepID=UPI001F18FD7E|nr:fibrinogen-like YCDxxxxGGGW domain-containing protein [Amycolatopsis sp. GM8]